MTKILLGRLLTTFFLATVHLAEAQQAGKIPRIGFVSGTGDANNPGPNVEAFRQGLRELGYVEGKNHQVEYRYIEGKSERIASLVTELIQLKVDLLVTASLASTRVAKKETKTIPIVVQHPRRSGRARVDRQFGAPRWKYHRPYPNRPGIERQAFRTAY